MTKILLAALLLVFCVSCAGAESVTVEFPAAGGELVNPFVGNMIWAMYDEDDALQPFTLVYANLLWADFEPQEGVYDFASFEETNHIALWRAAGKRLVLRFVMDVPSDKKHRDIPDWLFTKMGGRGTAYNISYGKGFCPDYTDPVLIAAHGKALAAIAEHFAGDDFLCCVELGSLGHWGEWHVHEKADSMPSAAVRRQYTDQYLRAFPDTMLLMRRPFAEAAAGGMGLYNDSAGAVRATEEWLEWISAGGAYDQTGEENALTAMPEAWKTAMIGGELAMSLSAEEMLQNLSRTIDLFARSHASFIGPNCFATDIERGGEWQDELDELMRHIGYRLRVSSVTLKGDQLTVRWTNTGGAPFYFPWTAAVRAVFPDGSRRVIPLDMDITALLPGDTMEATVTVPPGCAILEAGILDPATGDAAVQLDMCVTTDGGWHRLLSLSK